MLSDKFREKNIVKIMMYSNSRNLHLSPYTRSNNRNHFGRYIISIVYHCTRLTPAHRHRVDVSPNVTSLQNVNVLNKNEKMNGWIDNLDSTSFSTVFQSYQDDRRIIMKGCVQGTPFMIEKISASGGDRTRDR